jgi:hypothetical protein
MVGDVSVFVRLGASGLIYVSSNIPDQAGVNYKTLKYVFETVRELWKANEI